MKWLRSQDFSLTSFMAKEGENELDKICEGYLYVQSRSLWKFPPHLWKRRYFLLHRDVLYFFKTEERRVDKDLESSWYTIKIDLDTGIYPDESKHGGKKYLIRINQGNRDFVLCSASQADRNTWLASLLTVYTRELVRGYSKRYGRTTKEPSEPFTVKKVPLGERHSSFVPKRVDDAVKDAAFEIPRKMQRQIPNASQHFKPAPSSVFKAESMFDLSACKENVYEQRKSFIALI